MVINVPCRRRSGLQEETNQAKDNVPSSFGQEPSRKQRRVNRCSPLIIKGKWISEALEEAMDAIENGTISLKKANRH